MFFLVFVLFLDCFFNMHLCAKLQPYRSKVFLCEARTMGINIRKVVLV